jgi:hypothetical protein
MIATGRSPAETALLVENQTEGEEMKAKARVR